MSEAGNALRKLVCAECAGASACRSSHLSLTHIICHKQQASRAGIKDTFRTCAVKKRLDGPAGTASAHALLPAPPLAAQTGGR